MRVSMALNGPLVSEPGLGSKVSMWLGPPLSHSRMHALARRAAASAATSRWSIGDRASPSVPTRPVPRNSRRVGRRWGKNIVRTSGAGARLVVGGELRRVEQDPEDVFEP